MVIISCSGRWILTTFLTLIIIQPLLLNLIIAQNLDYPSTIYPPLSWRNVLSSNFGSLEAAGVKPILVNGNFFCGFHCTLTAETCFFAISFNTSFASATADYSSPSPEIVWSANRNNPVQLEAELKFTQQGDLVLQDSHGALVWSTNTTATRLNLTNQGNLLLLDKTNKVVWQSFDHPTDSLLPGQRLAFGQKLRSSQSDLNLSEGLYSFTIDDQGYFMAYMEPDPSQVYYWTESVTMDLLGLNECNYPLVCGKYGLCSDSRNCTCPGAGGEFDGENSTYHFRPINFPQPDLGCFPVPPIACESSQDQSMLKLVGGYGINAFTLASYLNHTADEETCKQACFKDCSCKAAIFRQFNATFIDCTLASEVFSIGSNFYYYFYYKNYEGSNNMYYRSTYIKVQNPSHTQTTLKKNPSTVSVTISPKKRRALIMGSTLGSIFGLLLLCTTISRLVKKYSKKVEEEDYLDYISGLPTRFSYEELKVITKNFSIKLGKGGFGSVFQGTLLDGAEVAVKYLDDHNQRKTSSLSGPR
ncbi:hypothetical protein COLO4_33651 [Corchorus olitorius]|uniref:Bulb-type lectin domain-containing protein n=1 Tax=Corchorus olitorius TaxID=93759 RepID=A0A1R3GS58_9ROSI|nr:hypothetical protein COLO4_33651 [Corchorus olitorius]